MSWIEPVLIGLIAILLWGLHASITAYLQPKSPVVKHSGNVVSLEQRRKDTLEKAERDLERAMRLGSFRL